MSSGKKNAGTSQDRLHRSSRTKILNGLRTVFMLPPVERALSQITRDKAVESWLGRLPANYYQYAKPAQRKVLRHGIAYDLDIADLIDWAIYFGFSQKSKERLFGLVRPGDTVIDIGTNIGEMVLTFAKIVTPTGRVYGFEPDPINNAKCRRNISLNGFNNITLEPLALAHEASTFNLACIDDRNPGMNRIVPEGYAGQATRIKAVPFDEYVRSKAIDRIDVIKIDVEGFEHNVLKGAEATIERLRPKLFIEVCDEFLRGNATSATELVSWLRRRSYSITNAADGATIDEKTNLSGCAIDIVCVPR